MDWTTLGLLGGGALLSGSGGLFGQDPYVQGYAQSPGQSALQSSLFPFINQGIYSGMMGQGLYPVPEAPAPTYQVPQAPFSSPADFASGYDTILNRMIEPFGESLGSARGGWSGAGQQVLGSAMGEIAPQIMNQYTQSVLPYAQMQNQQGMLGYTMGQIPQWQQQVQSNAAPWNLAGMYSGTYGSPMINQGSPGIGSTATTLGMMSLLSGGRPLW